jgi:hypothetical protein
MARKTTTEATEDRTPANVELREGAQAAPETAGRSPRPGSKLAQVMALLEAPEGATIAEVMTATG